MPFDFDDEQMPAELPPELTVETVSAVAATKTDAPVFRRVVEEPSLDEDETKLAKMLYYRVIARSPVFPDSEDPLAIEVEVEIQDFCQSRIREIMGTTHKKRGRKPASVAPVNKTRRASGRAMDVRGARRNEPIFGANTVLRGPLTPAPAPAPASVDVTPKGSKSTGVEIVQEITDPNGFKMQRTYRQVVDKVSQKSYYLCYVKSSVDATEAGDGNKYELTTNASGGQYFRVVSEQTLPEGSQTIKPMTLAAITAASEAHANATMSAIRNSNNSLLSAAINSALQSE